MADPRLSSVDEHTPARDHPVYTRGRVLPLTRSGSMSGDDAFVQEAADLQSENISKSAGK